VGSGDESEAVLLPNHHHDCEKRISLIKREGHETAIPLLENGLLTTLPEVYSLLLPRYSLREKEALVHSVQRREHDFLRERRYSAEFLVSISETSCYRVKFHPVQINQVIPVPNMKRARKTRFRDHERDCHL
jgi:hypothetical protein